MELPEYASYDGVGLAALIRQGEVTAEEVAETALEAVRAVNPLINAVVETWPPEYRPSADDSPLAGTPFLIKDLGVAMAGKRLELGSRLAAGITSPDDSTLMRRVRRSGLVTLGRTATPEMGFSATTEPVLYGATRNPWDPARSAGGSSGGAAAAVAAGIVPLAHGTDAGGSLRIPSAATGVFGLKPSRGRVPVGPFVDEFISGLAVHGAISRSVRDSAALLDCVHGPELGDSCTAPRPERPYLSEVGREPDRLRIGFLTRAWGGAATDGEIVQCTLHTAALLQSLGHHVEETTVDLGTGWDDFVTANARIAAVHLADLIDDLAAASGRPADATTLEEATLTSYRYGRETSGTQFVRALAVRNRVARTLAGCFSRYDVLLTPTLPRLPAALGSYAEGGETLKGPDWTAHLFHHSPFTAAFNVAGTPAMSVPLAVHSSHGLPVGMQFAAAYGAEDLLFRLAGQLERARPWALRVPVVWAGGSRSAPTAHERAGC